MSCEFVLKKGHRRGECCGKTSGLQIDTRTGKWFCIKHYKAPVVTIREPTPVLPPDVLCEFNCRLSATSPEDIAPETPEERRRLDQQRGYINYKIIGPPVFPVGEALSMVYMAHLEGEVDPSKITKIVFLTHLRNAIDYINSRPDIYHTLGYSTDEMMLTNIAYDRYKGLFVTGLKKIESH